MPVAAPTLSISQANNSVLSLRERTIGKCRRLKLATRESVQQIGLETVLEGHQACVNCLDWNRTGSLLASGSDDGSLIIWDPFAAAPRHHVPTEHSRHIFSVKFVPHTNDQQVASCGGDSSIRVVNLTNGSTHFSCTSCHSDRVKRLEIHPNEPHTLLSAGEDGYVMQYDLREPHTCSQTRHNSKPKNLLFDLKPSPASLKSAKCIAMHPWKEELIAVGTDDVLVRLLDRRYVQRSLKEPFVAHYAPGHLLKNPTNKSCQSFGTTYVAFSPNGRELLANYHAEQVYLFNLNESTSVYRSFETAIKPLILNKPSPKENTPSKQKLDNYQTPKSPIYRWDSIRKINKSLPTPDKVTRSLHLLIEKIIDNAPFSRADLESLNEMLIETKNVPDLYLMRSEAFMARGWKGDYYQAIIDCCSALVLEPLNQCALSNIAYASFSLNDKEAVLGILDILLSLGPGYKDPLNTALDLWERMLKDNSQTNSSISVISETVSGSLDDLGRVSRSNSTNSRLEFYSDEDNEELETTYCTPFPDVKDFDLSDPQPYDFAKRFCGHCSMTTDIKEANFLGNNGEFIVAGSDDGAFYIWDKETTNLIKAVTGDSQVLNCLQPHPSICMLATSGVESTVKLWSPKADKKYSRDIESLDARCAQNQNFINVDPLEAMIMMLYQSRDT